MATIHATTMSPTKLELLTAWLPHQAWYVGPASPELHKAGGFRLDDPAGEVGIEFMIVNAVSGATAVTYHVPMTYRGQPLSGHESALLGTSMHGVLGTRWIYDGAADPVLLEQLTQLLCGLALPQHRSVSDQVDETVVVQTAATRAAAATARILRVLTASGGETSPSVTAVWTAFDSTAVAGAVVAP